MRAIWKGAVSFGLVSVPVKLYSATVAAWRLEPWGWFLGHVLAIIGIIEAIFALLGTGSLNYALATTAFPFILLWYLNRPSVKKAFGLIEE